MVVTPVLSARSLIPLFHLSIAFLIIKSVSFRTDTVQVSNSGLSPETYMFLPLNGTATSPNVIPGNCALCTKKEVLRTSNPIAIPDGGVIVTLNWFARAPPPIKLSFEIVYICHD